MEPPEAISDLFDRYRRVETVNIVQNLDSDQTRADEPVYGVCILAKTSHGGYLLVRHTYDLPGIKETD